MCVKASPLPRLQLDASSTNKNLSAHFKYQSEVLLNVNIAFLTNGQNTVLTKELRNA